MTLDEARAFLATMETVNIGDRAEIGRLVEAAILVSIGLDEALLTIDQALATTLDGDDELTAQVQGAAWGIAASWASCSYVRFQLGTARHLSTLPEVTRCARETVAAMRSGADVWPLTKLAE